jgi:hypothetical protein
MENEPVVEDYSVRLHADFEGEKYEFLISMKYDHLAYAPRYGAWLLKIVDSEHGFVQMVIDESTAGYIQEAAGLRTTVADPVTTSELESIRKARENSLDDLFKGEFDELGD